jgi:hypothetical protein
MIPLPVSLEVAHYAKALKAHTLTAPDVPERLRDAVQEYLMVMWQQKEKQ